MKRFGLLTTWLSVFSFLLLLNPVGRGAEAFLNSGREKRNPRMIFVLVDMSGSTNLARQTVYRDGFAKVYQNLDEGDRIMVGTITGRSYIDFKPTVDVEIPERSLWVNRIQFERELSETREEIRREVEELLSCRRGTQHTEILNSLNIADTIFHDERREKILVIFSDMIQDSREYNFAQVKITNDYIDRVIRQRQRISLIPNLTDVKVYVAGASGVDSQKYRSVERFWARYFERSGADFSPHRYGHSLIRFEWTS